MDIHVKRIYDPPQASDGRRVLVDRMWPRGLSKSEAHVDQWLKEIAPSSELRKWFNHDPERWSEFKQRYFKELAEQKDKLRELLNDTKKPITLLFAARDTEHNNAVALREYLKRMSRGK